MRNHLCHIFKKRLPAYNTAKLDASFPGCASAIPKSTEPALAAMRYPIITPFISKLVLRLTGIHCLPNNNSP